jgi:hypothetical protein
MRCKPGDPERAAVLLGSCGPLYPSTWPPIEKSHTMVAAPKEIELATLQAGAALTGLRRAQRRINRFRQILAEVTLRQAGKLFVLIVFLVVAFTGAANAQEATRWGVTGSFAPTWKVPEDLSGVFGGVPDPDASTSAFDIKGSEFRIGFVRGKEFGGDYSVSLVRKRFASDSRIAQQFTYDKYVFNPRSGYVVDGTYNEGFDYALNGVTLTGVEYVRFRPFATIKRRVQVGLNYGGGIGVLQGNATGYTFGLEGATPQVLPADNLKLDSSEHSEPAGLMNIAGYTLKPIPLAKLELAVAGMVAPGLKVRASGGFNFPGYQVASFSFVYLFGSR